MAELTGLPKDAIKIHNHLIGGGFGRRLEADGTVLAVKIAKHVDGPVKVIWSREEDIQHDMYRPYYLDRLSAGLDAAGSRWLGPIGSPAPRSSLAMFPPIQGRIDFDAVEAAAEPPYALPNIHVDYVRVEPPGVRTASGAASDQPTTSSWSKVSWTSWRTRRSRIPSLIAKRLLGHNPRALAVLIACCGKSRLGITTSRTAWPRRFRYNSHSAATCRRSPRSKWRPTVCQSQADRLCR